MKKKVVGIAGVMLVPFVLFSVFYLLAPNFGFHSVPIIVSQAMIPTAMGLGMATIMLSGLMDFSAGCRAIFGAAMGFVGAQFLGVAGFIIGCFAGSMLVSLLLALLYRFVKIPSMVVSMGVVLLAEAFTYWLSQQTGSSGYMKLHTSVYSIASFPNNILITAAACVLFYIVTYHTRIGCQINAVGDNEVLVQSMGVNSSKVKFAAFLISGVFIGFAAMLQMSYSGAISLQTGMATMQLVFKPMMGVMIGLVLVRLWNVLPLMILIGELTISIIFNGLIAMGLTDDIQNIVLGAFLLIVMGVSQNTSKFVEMRRRNAVRKSAAKSLPSANFVGLGK